MTAEKELNKIICLLLLTCWNVEIMSEMLQEIKHDETSICSYDPKIEWQSSQWKFLPCHMPNVYHNRNFSNFHH